jgi:hypothetical protein
MPARRAEPSAHVSLDDALKQLPGPTGTLSALLFEHGSLQAKLYTPRREDHQTPHAQDEIYVVARGTGVFFDGALRRRFAPGTFLFVAAGQTHRFEDFSDDVAIWVFFFGPRGGEVPAGPA